METQNTGGTATTSSVKPTTVFRLKQHYPLHAIFEPESIAVIGATEQVGSEGGRCCRICSIIRLEGRFFRSI